MLNSQSSSQLKSNPEIATSEIDELPFWQDRDCSWLSYAERILDQAHDETVPLLERLDFMASYQFKLHQFVEQRMGSLTDHLNMYEYLSDSSNSTESKSLAKAKKNAKKKKAKADKSENVSKNNHDENGKEGLFGNSISSKTAKKRLKKTQNTLQKLYKRIGSLSFVAQYTYINTCDRLREFGIHHIFGDRLKHDLPEYQHIFLHEYLKENVFGYLAPYVVDKNSPFPYLEDGGLYIAVELISKPKSSELKSKKAKKSKRFKDAVDCTFDGEVKLGLIALPDQCVRLIELPTGDGKNVLPTNSRKELLEDEEALSVYSFVLLEDALCLFAKDIFPKYKVKSTAVINLVRNADLDKAKHIDVDDGYLPEMDAALERRAHEEPLLLMTSDELTKPLRKILRAGLGLKSDQIQLSGLPLNMDFVKEIVEHVGDGARKRLSWVSYEPKWLRTGPLRLNPNYSIMDQVAKHDVMLIYPFESMDPFLEMLHEAAIDPKVSSIDITLFRLAEDSKVVSSLMEAARLGKKVRAVVELRANLSEDKNSQWARRLKQAGCEVIFGLDDYKVHAKICCVTRSVEGALQRITQIGTGNYNEHTATFYTDICYMTADSNIGSDAAKFFNHIAKQEIATDYRVLITSPLQLKPMLIDKIDSQIKRAKEGKSSGIFFKVKAVTDKDIIAKLVEASNAGVPVVMIVRDSTCLLPMVEGYTEKIRIASIVGRLTEHGRIYGFGAWDDMEIYLSSADLMERNLARRVEMAWPITNNILRKRIIQYVNLTLNDTAKLRELLPDGTYTPLGSLAKEDKLGRKELFDSQEYLLRKG